MFLYGGERAGALRGKLACFPSIGVQSAPQSPITYARVWGHIWVPQTSI